jgi:molecular chaperone GrpE
MPETTSNFPDPADADVNALATDAPLADAEPVMGSEEMTALEAQKERYLRLAAEYDNYRKRTAKESLQAASRGQADVVRAILTSLDDLNRFASLDPATTDAATIVHGVALVEKNVLKALTDIGVETIDPVSLPFDPNLHEAVTTQPAESKEEDHMVAQVYQRGYMLKGQLLRPARVVVKQYQ